MDFWNHLTSMSAAMAAVVIPVVIAYIGNNYTKATKERELQGKFVELSITILRDLPTPGTENLRKWALEIIDKYSGVPISTEAKDDLVKRVPLVSDNQKSGIKFTKPDGDRIISKIILSESGQTDNLDGVIKYLSLSNIKQSYHYIIGLDGKVVNLIDDSLIAFGARDYNEHSVFILLMHLRGQTYPEKQLESLVKLLVDLSKRYSIEPKDILLKAEIDERKDPNALDLGSIIKDIRSKVAEA